MNLHKARRTIPTYNTRVWRVPRVTGLDMVDGG
jgi:hypothetical protein